MTDVTNERINGLATSIERLDANHSRVEAKIDMLIEAMRTLARLEERNKAVDDRLTEGARTMHDLTTRLHILEQHQPGLLEMRKWVVLGVLSVVGMMAATLFRMVLKS